MKNPPFPYSVIIYRGKMADDPFKTPAEPVEVYNGECDFSSNKFPATKDGVLIGKYNLYLPINSVEFLAGDTLVVVMRERVEYGKLVDYNATNLGTTIQWDKVNN